MTPEIKNLLTTPGLIVLIVFGLVGVVFNSVMCFAFLITYTGLLLIFCWSQNKAYWGSMLLCFIVSVYLYPS